MKVSSKLASLIQSQTAMLGVQLGAGFVVIGLIFWKLQFSTDAICCGDFDGYYHIKWSRMLWESMRDQSFPPIFTWLPFTTLNPNDYVDHHLLFHIFQIPFTWFSDLRFGAKLASVLFATLAVTSCYWLLLRYKVRYPLLWLLGLLACSVPFLFRLNMAKAPPFAIFYLIIGIHLLFKKKYWPLVPLSFVFALTYDMFVLLLLAGFFWTTVLVITEHRFQWRPLAWMVIGMLAGFVLNPYFPDNLQLFYEHLKVKITLSGFTTSVGQEWYPYNSWEFLGNSLVACIAMVVGYIFFEVSERKRSHYSLFFLLFSTALMIMTARWKRMAEYWPPFAILFSAFSIQPWLQGTRSIFSRLPREILAELQPYLDLQKEQDETETANQAPSDIRDLVQTISVAVVAVILGVVMFFNLSKTVEDISSSSPHDYYKAGGEWMRTNITSPQTIFNTDWDDFPRLFYYDPAHNYVSGLDPAYLYEADPALSRLYERITLGDEEDPGPLIREHFGARYVFTDKGHDKFYNNAIESGWFDKVYEDDDCTILQIRDYKAEPPAEEP